MKRLRSLICGAALLGPLGTSSALAPALLCAAALTAAAAIAPSPAQAILGDVNCDGVVNATDAQVLANFLVGISTSVPCPQNADVNSDGQVNVADVLLILQLSKGLRTSFSYQSTSVLAVTPSSGTANILLGAEISAIFSNPVSSASLPGNFTVADAVSGQLSTGTFRCSQNGTISVFTPGVPFLPAHNYVVSLSTGITDNFGNPISTSVVVNFQTQPLGTMNLTSVNNSTATMNTLLSSPIAVQLFTSTGAPAVQIPVVFTAQMGNGTFQPSGLRKVTVLTDVNGNAAMAYKTGTQAMVNTVSIFALGFSTVPALQITTMPTPAVNLRLYTGGNQTGGAGSVAPLPLVVQATDAGGDYIQGTTVTFTVPQGAGSFAGQTSSAVVTNSTGTAAVMFTFGPSSGTVIVTASFPGMAGISPSFPMHDILPQLTTSTYVSGNVIDTNTLLPLTSVYVYLTDNPSIWTRSNQNGYFILPTSTGPHVVEVDGFESGLIGGQLYPTVSYPVNAVQGMTTGLGIPAMLPELDQHSYLDVSNVVGGTLTIHSSPLWQLYVAPGQVTFQNGSHTGRLYASFVSHATIPMPVAGGKASRFDDTVQPPTVLFNPPAQVTFPNADGLPAGSVNEIFTLDYISGAFKQTGVAVVSEDGTVLTSLPGQGITQGGWHTAPPPPPPCGNITGGVNSGNTGSGGSITYGGNSAGLSGGSCNGSGTLYCVPAGGGPVVPIYTCNGPGTPPINPPPPPCTGASCSCPQNVTCPPPSIQLSLSPPQETIGLQSPSSLQVTASGGASNGCCQYNNSVSVTIQANPSNVIQIAGSLGPTTIVVPINTTYSLPILGNAGGTAEVTAAAAGAQPSSAQVTVQNCSLQITPSSQNALTSGPAVTFQATIPQGCPVTNVQWCLYPPAGVTNFGALSGGGSSASTSGCVIVPAGSDNINTVTYTPGTSPGSGTIGAVDENFNTGPPASIVVTQKLSMCVEGSNITYTTTSAGTCGINGYVYFQLIDSTSGLGVANAACIETIATDRTDSNVTQLPLGGCGISTFLGIPCTTNYTLASNGTYPDGTLPDKRQDAWNGACNPTQKAVTTQTITCNNILVENETVTFTPAGTTSPGKAQAIFSPAMPHCSTSYP